MCEADFDLELFSVVMRMTEKLDSAAQYHLNSFVISTLSGPPPDFSLRWSFVGEGKPGDAKIIVEIGWDQYEHEMECTDNPYRNETVFQFLADVQCTEEAPKPGSKSNVYWHGLIWDGNQTKASKPK